MSDFTVNLSQLDSISAQLNNASIRIMEISGQVNTQANRLNREQGFGIPQTRQLLIRSNGDLRRLGQDVQALRRFISAVASTAQQNDDAAFRELRGGVVRPGIPSFVPIPLPTPNFPAGWTIGGGSGSGRPFLDFLHEKKWAIAGLVGDAVFGALKGMGVKLPAWLVGVKNIKTGIGLVTSPFKKSAISFVTGKVAHVGAAFKKTGSTSAAIKAAFTKGSAAKVGTAAAGKASCAIAVKGVGAAAAKGAKWGALAGPKGVAVGAAVGVAAAGVGAAVRWLRRR